MAHAVKRRSAVYWSSEKPFNKISGVICFFVIIDRLHTSSQYAWGFVNPE